MSAAFSDLFFLARARTVFLFGKTKRKMGGALRTADAANRQGLCGGVETAQGGPNPHRCAEPPFPKGAWGFDLPVQSQTVRIIPACSSGLLCVYIKTHFSFRSCAKRETVLPALPHMPLPCLLHDGPARARLRSGKPAFFCHRQRQALRPSTERKGLWTRVICPLSFHTARG